MKRVAVTMAAALLLAAAFFTLERSGPARQAAAPSAPEASSRGASSALAGLAGVDASKTKEVASKSRVAFAGSTTDPRDAASCRLAMELSRCERARIHLRFVPAAARAWQEDASCNDVRSDAPSWKLLLEAAKRGHVPSMARFGSGAVILRGGSVEEYDLEALAEWRAHAYDFLQRAAAAGEGDAIARLARELAEGGRGTRAVPYDPVRGLAYGLVLMRHAEPTAASRVESNLREGGFGPPPRSEDWKAAEALSRTLVSPAAEARLEGWTPTRYDRANDYGCAG